MEKKTKGFVLRQVYRVAIDGVWAPNGQMVEVVGFMTLDGVPDYTPTETWIEDAEPEESQKIQDGTWICLKFLEDNGTVDYIPAEYIHIQYGPVELDADGNCPHKLETTGYKTDEYGNSHEEATCTQCGTIFK